MAPDADLITLDKVGIDAAVAMLWRDDRIPEWLDISLYNVLPKATLVDVRASRCLMRAADVASAPINIKGPFLPQDYVEGVRFRLSDVMPPRRS